MGDLKSPSVPPGAWTKTTTQNTLIKETVCRLCPKMCSVCVCDGSVNSTVCAYWAKCKISVVTVEKGGCDRSE